MASAAAAIEQAANPKKVDGDLWWDSFVALLEELDNAPLASDLSASLVKRIRASHRWFLGSVSSFKPSNAASRIALDSPKISIGQHEICVDAQLREVALVISSNLDLDEVQSYILIQRCGNFQKGVVNLRDAESLHLVLIHYFLERQCMLKCIKQIFTRALCRVKGSDETDVIWAEALQLVHGGLDEKLLEILWHVVSAAFSEKTEADITTLWVEASLLESNLILDILFIVYYDNLCVCTIKQWKKLAHLFMEVISGSLHIEKLAVSNEARNSFSVLKVQLLLILLETLDLENLLCKVYNEVSFRDGFSVFSVADIQEMDAIVSDLMALESMEAGPLVLAWAVFLCLLLSLPGRQDCSTILENDHVGYVRQAMKVAPFNYLIEALSHDFFWDSDVPVSGFMCVLRTFISSFISAYEISYQVEDNTLSLILDIVCRIYRGEEALCMQFWDKDSFVDRPIRSLLLILESEFPFHSLDFIRLLSSLCEGVWPAECVYNFLDNSSGITLPFGILDAEHAVSIYEVLETSNVLHVPGVEGLVIPNKTRGQVLKFIDQNSVLVRWEHAHSGVTLLLLRLAQEFHSIENDELDLVLDLLHRMIHFNKVLCFTLLNNDNVLPVRSVKECTETTMRMDLVKILSSLLCHLFNDINNTVRVSMCINILSEIIKCSPSHVIEVTLRTGFFGLCNYVSSSDEWFLSRGLAKMILADCEENIGCVLTISVLEYIIHLIELAAESNFLSSLVVFSVQYVLVNHEYWRYKLRSDRWKITLKVLEVMRKSIELTSTTAKHKLIVRDILFDDSSVNNVLIRIMSVTSQNLECLYVSRCYEIKEVEGLHLAISSICDILASLLMETVELEDIGSDVPVLVRKMLLSDMKPIPVFAAVVSLACFHRDSAIQSSAFRLLSLLFLTAAKIGAHSFENFSLVANDTQLTELVSSIISILNEDVVQNEELIIGVFNLLISAARYQPSFFVNIISVDLNMKLHCRATVDVSDNLAMIPTSEVAVNMKLRSTDSNTMLIGSILQYLERSTYLIQSAPRVLFGVLNFLNVLWEMGVQYVQILDIVRSSEFFWKHLSVLMSSTEAITISKIDVVDSKDSTMYAYRYHCQAAVLSIMTHDIFLFGRISDLTLDSQSSESTNIIDKSRLTHEKLKGSKDVLLTWCENSVLESLIKFYSSSVYDSKIIYRAKMALSLVLVHLVVKLLAGDAGSLSLSLCKKIDTVLKELKAQPAFSTLLAKYELYGYSKKDEASYLIFNDLYHHLLGELEGREISRGPFKELSSYLLALDAFQDKDHKHGGNMLLFKSDVHFFDLHRLKTELGITIWEHSTWKESISTVHWAINLMHEANVVLFLSDSKCSALKALTDLVVVHNIKIDEKSKSLGRDISSVLQSSIEVVCRSLREVEEILPLSSCPVQFFLEFYVRQVELLNYLCRSLFTRDSVQMKGRQLLPIYILVIRTSSVALRLLSDQSLFTAAKRRATKLFLMLLLISAESSYHVEKSNEEVGMITELSLVTLGLLPILCRYAESPEYGNLSLASMDLIVRGFLSPNTWLPILQKHLKLEILVRKLKDKDSATSASVILKFLLTLAQIKGGAKMLQASNCFPTLKVLFNLFVHEGSSDLPKKHVNDESQEQIWGLGLAIITSIVYALDDDSSSTEIVDAAISYFLSETNCMIHRCLSPPNFPSGDHSMKRQKTQKAQTSLTSLVETAHAIMLICALAKHRVSWISGTRGKDSELRESCIHMLALISKGAQHIGDSTNSLLLLCPPVLKNEIEASEKPSFIRIHGGWFNLSAIGCSLPKRKAPTISSTDRSLITKDLANGNADICQSSFSDMVALQVYKITFLLLKFLCIHAKSAVARAEEVQFIDLAHFPELPSPDILHGLQDQTIEIITEVCKANQSKSIEQSELRSVCLLLMQILEKALYLELCVSQSCGFKPILGWVEDFSSKIKSLIQVCEEYACFKAMLKSLKQIISVLYPGLLQMEN